MAARLRRKPKGSYHHPDLERALVDAAIRTIREQGVEALTLRDVGAQLGVSRTALYRHFADKSALLARVALEGFRIFRHALRSAVDDARAHGADPMEPMGAAYIRFALDNQSHYQTMFSGTFGPWEGYPGLITEAAGAFAVLLKTVEEEQVSSRIASRYDSVQLAHIFWAGVHGIATLGIDGRLGPPQGSAQRLEELCRLQTQFLLAGLRAAPIGVVA